MAREYQVDQSKPGFLGLGFRVGESLPAEVATSDVPNQIGENGEVLWKKDSFVRWFEMTDPVRSYAELKRDWVYMTISRAYAAFSKAMMGYRPHNIVDEGAYFRLGQIFAGWDNLLQHSKEWEMAPMQVQKVALKSAIEFISNQSQASQTA